MRPMTVAAGLITLLGLFAGLCSLFALVATGLTAWREHVKAGWPEATATIERCSVEERRTTGSDLSWWLRCHIGFRREADQIETQIFSRILSSQSRGYPELMDQWVDDHPNGSRVAVRYDPADPKVAIPATDYMPNGEPKTPSNLRVLAVFSLACAVLLAIAMLLRRRAKSLSPQA
jgi:hypothetical protein